MPTFFLSIGVFLLFPVSFQFLSVTVWSRAAIYPSPCRIVGVPLASFSGVSYVNSSIIRQVAVLELLSTMDDRSSPTDGALSPPSFVY